MPLSINVHDVAKIQVSADGRPFEHQGHMHWWQSLLLFDRHDTLIGEITLHLHHPEVALPVGDQPPYWGLDPQRQPLVIEADEVPF